MTSVSRFNHSFHNKTLKFVDRKVFLCNPVNRDVNHTFSDLFTLDVLNILESPVIKQLLGSHSKLGVQLKAAVYQFNQVIRGTC